MYVILLIILGIIVVITIMYLIYISKKRINNDMKPIIINNPSPETSESSTCICTDDCPKDHLCFNGTCTPRPSSWNECLQTICSDSLICIDHHIMMLKDDKFIMLPHWWILKDCVDITDGPYPDSVYILTKDELFCSSILQPSNITRLTSSYIIPDDYTLKIHKLFMYNYVIHGLGSNHKIYRGLTNYEMNKYNSIPWEWERVTYMCGRDISDDNIDDITTGPNQIIILHVNKHRLMYNKGIWSDIITDQIQTIIKYGSDPCLYLEIYDYRLYLYKTNPIGSSHDSNIILKLHNILDAVITPDQYLIFINNYGIVRKMSINDISTQSIIHGTSTKLCMASNRVWSITSYQCYRI